MVGYIYLQLRKIDEESVQKIVDLVIDYGLDIIHDDVEYLRVLAKVLNKVLPFQYYAVVLYSESLNCYFIAIGER